MTRTDAAVPTRSPAATGARGSQLHDSVETLQALAFIRDRCLALPPRPVQRPAPGPIAATR